MQSKSMACALLWLGTSLALAQRSYVSIETELSGPPLAVH